MSGTPAKVLACLIALLFLAGCAGKVSEADRRTCINLTYYYDTSIPACTSQEDCLSEARKAFPVETTFFPAPFQQTLRDYFNRLAKAWYHLTLSRKKLKEINDLCTSSSTFAEMRQQANDFYSNLALVAQEQDAGSALSVELLEAARAYLLSQDVNQLPDTPLFDDFRELTRNSNGFRERVFDGPPSYASLQFAAAQHFVSLLPGTPLGQAPLREAQTIDFASKYTRKVVPFIPVSKVFIPVVGDFLESFAQRLSSTLSVRESLELLRQTKPYAFFEAFARFLSPQSSSARAFTDLFAGLAAHTQSLEAEAQSLQLSVQKELAAVDQQLAALPPDVFDGFDASLVSALALELQAPKSFAQDALSLGSPEHSPDALRLQAAFLRQRLLVASQPGRTLGKRVLGLRQLLEESKAFSARARSLSTDSLGGLASLCKARASLISRQLNGFSTEAKALLAVSTPAKELRTALASFEASAAASPTLQLRVCKTLLETHRAFEQFVADPQGNEAGQQDEFLDCLDFTERALAARKEDLRPLFPAFSRLKLLYESNASLSNQTLPACRSLRTQIKEILAQAPDVQRIQQQRKQLAEEAAALEALGPLAPPQAREKLQTYQKTLKETQAYFDGPTLNPDKALDHLRELAKDFDKLSAEAQETFVHALLVFLAETASVREEQPKEVALNQPIRVPVSVEFHNPYPALAYPGKLSLPYAEAAGLAYSTLAPPFTKAEFSERAIELYVSSIPAGNFGATFYFEQDPVTLEATHTLEQFSAREARLLTTFLLHTKATVENLRLTQPLLQGTGPSTLGTPTQLRVTSMGSALPFTLNSQGLEVKLPQVFNKQLIEARYTLPNPLDLSLEALPSQTLDLNTLALEYRLQLRNRLPLELKSTALEVSLPLPENARQPPKLLDSSGKSLEFLSLQSGKLTFSSPKLPPEGEALVFIRFTVQDFGAYWQGLLKALDTRAEALLQSSPEAGLRERAQALRTQINGLLGASGLSAQQRFPETAALANGLAALEAEQATFEKAEAEITPLQVELETLFAREQQLAQILSGTPFYSTQLQRLAALRARFTEALADFETGHASAALSQLREIRADLSKSAGAQLLTEAADQSIAEAKQSLKDAANFPEPAALPLKALFDEAVRIQAALEASARYAEPEAALQAYRTFQSALESFRTRFAALSAEQASQQAARLQVLREFSTQIEGILAELEAQVSSQDSARLAELGFGALPKKLAAHRKAFDALQKNAPIDALPPPKALSMREVETLEGKWNALLVEVEDTRTRLSSAAVSEYNSAAARYNALAPTAIEATQAETLLTQAKQALEVKDYFAALDTLQAATGLMALKPQEKPFVVPLPVYPLLLVLAALLYFRLRSQRKSTEITETQTVERAYGGDL